ncbi:MAG: hypothetical protein R6V50_04720 [Thermoplasmatota archaeon]
MRRTLNMILVVFLIVLPSLSLTAIAQNENIHEQDFIQSSSEQQNQISAFDKQPLLWLLYRSRYLKRLYTGRYFIRQSMPPLPIQASPGAVTLNYNEETHFTIGGLNPETGDYYPLVLLAGGGSYSWGWMSKKTGFYFEVDSFENIGVWNIQFDPPTLEVYPNRKNLDWPGAFLPLKTNVSVMLKSNVTDPSMFTQDIVLKINVFRVNANDLYGIFREGFLLVQPK